MWGSGQLNVYSERWLKGDVKRNRKSCLRAVIVWLGAVYQWAHPQFLKTMQLVYRKSCESAPFRFVEGSMHLASVFVIWTTVLMYMVWPKSDCDLQLNSICKHMYWYSLQADSGENKASSTVLLLHVSLTCFILNPFNLCSDSRRHFWASTLAGNVEGLV